MTGGLGFIGSAVVRRLVAAAVGRHPTVSLSEGLASTIDWHLEHQDWMTAVLDDRYDLERLRGTI